jgi:predicted Ser/Thr protein kinase
MSFPSTIAHYRILEKLGEGGMGEVWRAADTKLGREVAIKILPESFAQDAGRMARFTREAKVLASLNHPNIAAIYGVEERALVMELVEGPTLAERLARGPIPVDEALAVARQIAEALECAHERGVVHRDLKPANIKITPEGRVKVLDFGLAKGLAGESGAGDPLSSPTITIGATLAGTIMGTAAYMSPEQARGESVDRRADVWAFGAVLYEMLTGMRAFPKSEPDYSRCPASLPPRIDYLLKRCLRKKPGERLRDIAEARIWIDEARIWIDEARISIDEARISIDEAREKTGTPAPRPQRRWMAGLGAIAAAILLGAFLWRTISPPAAPRAWTGTFLGGPHHALGPRISPDGKTLAFQTMVDGLLQVAVMKPESGNWTVLTHEREHGAVQEIAWSPDGATLYFSRMLGSPRGIYSIPVLGGEERLVLEGAANPEMLPDGSLLVVKIDARRRFQIHHYWPETGKLEPLPAELDITDISMPLRTFPDGKEAAYVGRPLAGDSSGLQALYALDLQTGKSRRIAPGLAVTRRPSGAGFALAITADGKTVLLGLTDGDLRTVVAVPRTGNAPPETWLSGTQGTWYLDAGPDGSLYMDQVLEEPEALRFPAGGGRPERLLRPIALGPALVREDGEVLVSGVFAGHTRAAMGRPFGELTPVSETREEADVWIAKAGERGVAFSLGPEGKRIIAIASLPDGRIVRRLAVPGGAIDGLASSPDGRRIFYVARQKVWSIPAEGGEPTRVGDGDSVAVGGGGTVLQVNADDGFHLMRVPLTGGEPVKVPVASGAALTSVGLNPAAVGPGERLLLQVNEPHMWFYRMATVDLKTGRLDLIPVEFDGDIWYPGWTPDGKIVATGLEYGFSLWRMHR